MSRRPNGPIEDREVPSELQAKVITPGPDPHLYGFSVESDLAIHYRFPELVQLAMTGVAPDEAKGRAFDVALQFLAPLAIAEAPTHAAALTHMLGAKTSSLIAVTCIALAERARFIVAQHTDLLEALDKEQEVPSRHLADNADDVASVDRLRSALASAGVQLPGLDRGVARWAALVMTLHFAGIRRPEQLETAFVLAGLAPSIAEASCHDAAEITRYPIRLPAFIYEEP